MLSVKGVWLMSPFRPAETPNKAMLCSTWGYLLPGGNSRFMREAIAPIQNKVGALLASPIIRNILGQVRNKVSIPFIMDDSRIFIANLSKGRMGTDKSNLLGSLLVTQFQLAAMARANRPESERRDFFLHIERRSKLKSISTPVLRTIAKTLALMRLQI